MMNLSHPVWFRLNTVNPFRKGNKMISKIAALLYRGSIVGDEPCLGKALSDIEMSMVAGGVISNFPIAQPNVVSNYPVAPPNAGAAPSYPIGYA